MDRSLSNPRLQKELQPCKERRRSTVFESFNRKTTFLNDLEEFGSDTSAHGLKYISESPRLLTKLMFLALWLSATCYALNAIATSITQFMEKPTGTKFDVIVEDEGEVQAVKFPTITVCSLNKIKKSYLNDSRNKYINEYISALDKYVNYPQILEKVANRIGNATDEMSEIKDTAHEDILRDGGPSKDGLLACFNRAKFCKNVKVFNSAPIFTMELTTSGLCWRVNPEGKLKGKMGDFGALKLLFWADVKDYSSSTNFEMQAGFLVAFHDSRTHGDTMNSGYLMSPGNYYKADLQLKHITRSEKKAHSCNASLKNTTYGDFNEGACAMECKDKYVYDRCGCVMITPPENNYLYRPCTVLEWANCGRKHYQDWFDSYTDPYRSREDAICPCETACKEVRYESSISSSSISPGYANLSFEYAESDIKAKFDKPDYNISYDSPQDILENLMIVEILFSSIQKYDIKEVITYDTNNLLGDIGGVLGLFLGASLFTIIEFILFGAVSLAKYCCRATASGWLDVT